MQDMDSKIIMCQFWIMLSFVSHVLSSDTSICFSVPAHLPNLVLLKTVANTSLSLLDLAWFFFFHFNGFLIHFILKEPDEKYEIRTA